MSDDRVTDSTMTEIPEHEGLVARLIALADAPLPIGNDARLDLREAADELERQAVAIQTLVEALEVNRRVSLRLLDGLIVDKEQAETALHIADNTLASLKQPGGR